MLIKHHTDLINGFIRLVVARPILTICICLTLIAPFFIGLSNFHIGSNPRDFLGKGMPMITHLEALEQEYIEDLNVIVMLRPKTGDIFQRDVLEAVHWLTEQAWSIPFVKRVDSLTNFQHTRVEADDLYVESLVNEPANMSEADIAHIKTIALSEPVLVNLLVAADGNATAVNIIFSVDLSDSHSVASIDTQISTLKNNLATKFPNLNIHESGFVSMTTEWRRAAMRDVRLVFSSAIIVIFLGLWYFLGNIKASIAVLATGMLSVLMSMGLFGLINCALNPATQLAMLMILVLGIADGIHITKSARRLLTTESNIRTAVSASIRSNFTPIALTSITTAVGFLTFKYSGYRGVEMMGYFVAFGVVMAFLLSVTLLPALLMFCKLKPDANSTGEKPPHKLAEFVIRYHKWLLCFTLPAVLISAYCISLNEMDERFSLYLTKDHPFIKDLHAFQQHLTGTSTMIYNFNSSEQGGVHNLEFMQKVESFAQWARTQPATRHVSTYTDVMKRLNRDLHQGDTNFYQLPESRTMAAQYMLLYELSLPFGLDLTNLVNMDKSGTRVVVTTNDMSIKQTKIVIANAEKWLAENAPDFNPASNSNMLSSLLMASLGISKMVEGGITALIIIGCILLFTFRSFYAGILCVITVVAPLMAGYGLWGIFNGIIDMAAALTVCMVIGIAVDFSVHFVSKYVHGIRTLNYSVEDSIRYTFQVVSGPIMITTVVLTSGFTILIFSLFKYNVVMGSLTALCIALSAFSTFLLLPSILLLQNRGQSKKQALQKT